MLDETEIAAIAATIGEKLKKAQSRKSDSKEPYEAVEWSELYKKAVKHEEEIDVHAEGEFPEKLLGNTFPNETKEEMQYRNKTFQPITKPYWGKAIKSLNRIWSEQNYTIDWKDEKAKEYFTQDLPLYNDIRTYFKSVATKSKINDPNAVMVVDFRLPVKKNAEGVVVVDDSKEIAPYPTIFESCDVIEYKEDAYCTVVSDEKSIVSYNDRNVAEGLVFYLYDTMNIWRISQVGKKVDWKFEAQLYYPHNLEYLPAWKLKGTPEKVIDGTLYYESHFAPAIPYLNEAVILHSTLKASISKVAYPIRVYYDQDCGTCSASGYTLLEIDGQATQVKCKTCGGSGKTKFSPFSDYVHSKPGATDSENIQFPGLTYVSPDNTILEFGKNTVDDYIGKAFLFLNIDAVPDGMKAGLGDGATATKSKIDRDEQFVSILDISNELFELMQMWIWAASQIRYNTDIDTVINPPKSFELISASELTDELTAAKDSSIPDFAISQLTQDYIEKRFPQNGSMAKASRIAQYCDPLYVKDDAEVSLAKSNFEPWEIVLHYHIFNFLLEKQAANPEYLNGDIAAIKADMVQMAKDKAAQLNTGQNTAGQILNSIAGGADGGANANNIGGVVETKQKTIDGVQRQIQRGEQGGWYYISDTGNKVYV